MTSVIMGIDLKNAQAKALMLKELLNRNKGEDDEIKVEIKGSENEVTAVTKSVSFRSNELRELAEISAGHNCHICRTGANVRITIW